MISIMVRVIKYIDKKKYIRDTKTEDGGVMQERGKREVKAEVGGEGK